MKTELILLILLTVTFGCAREPQNTASASLEEPTTAQLQADRQSSRTEPELTVIGQVIGTQSERVSQTLQQAGINCMLQGDEFHEISVPKNNKQEAVGVLAKDARQAGYEIIWKTQ